MIRLEDWVASMIDSGDIDTVEDKVAIVIDTDDVHAFDNLFPPAPDLRLPGTQDLTDGELFYIIENGIRLTGMPAWGDDSEQSKRETWHLVAFLRHLPRLTPGEKLQMERLNPKSPDEWREMQEDQEFLQGKEQSGSGAHHGSHH
jgi:hypothetical protein